MATTINFNQKNKNNPNFVSFVNPGISNNNKDIQNNNNSNNILENEQKIKDLEEKYENILKEKEEALQLKDKIKKDMEDLQSEMTKKIVQLNDDIENNKKQEQEYMRDSQELSTKLE